MPLLLALNIFHNFFYCFYYWLWRPHCICLEQISIGKRPKYFNPLRPELNLLMSPNEHPNIGYVNLASTTKQIYVHICAHWELMLTKKYTKFQKFSLCKGQKFIDKQPVWITKPYMKAFLEERKDILNYCFFFPYVPHVHRSVQKRKKSISYCPWHPTSKIFIYKIQWLLLGGIWEGTTLVKILQSCHFNILGISHRCFRKMHIKKNNK